MRTLTTLAIGAAGGFLFELFGLPLPWLLGSLTAVAAVIWSGWRLILARPPVAMAYSLIGVLVGTGFQPDILDRALHWWEPLLGIVVFTAGSSVAGWLFFTKVGRLDPATSILASAPGGFNVMVILSTELRADTARIAIVHAMRVIVIMATLPILVEVLTGGAPGSLVPQPVTVDEGYGNTVAFLSLGVLGLLAGKILPLPAGPVIVPICLSAAAHLSGLVDVAAPDGAIVPIQIVVGAAAGCRFNGLPLREATLIAFLAVVWGIILVMAALAIAAAGAELGGHHDLPELFLAFTPGGLPEMSLLALNIDADISFIVICNMLRFTLATAVAPLVFRWIARKRKPSVAP